MKIDGPAGRLEVALDEPAGAPRLGVLVAHPHPLLGGTMDNGTVKAVAEACAQAGALALRFNVRGAGESEGELDPGGSLVAQGADDAEAALRFLRARLPEGAGVGLAGYSFGSLVTLQLLSRGVRPRAVALLGVPTRTDGLSPDLDALRAYGGPVLVVQGARDEHGPPGDLQGALPPNARLHVVERAGHFFTGKWGQVGEMAAAFLAGRLRQP